MSSKQINFFLIPEDLPEISNFFSEKQCEIIHRISNDPKVPIRYDFLGNPDKIFQVYLCNSKNLDKIVYEHLESNDNYYIDTLKSYCIEFSIGGFYPYSNKHLHSSRLYYIFEYYEDNNLIRKDESFIQWADDIIKEFKKRFLCKSRYFSNRFVSERFSDWARVNNAKQTIDGTKFIID